MKLAIIGSRSLASKNLGDYISADVTEIVSGGAKGIDTAAAEYAKAHGIPLTVFLPAYEKYGRAAPLKRNEQIADYANAVLALWDGKSKGTLYTIGQFKKRNKPTTVIRMKKTTG